MPSHKLLVATTNSKKLTELRMLLRDLDLELLCLKDLESYTEVPEDGKSFRDNAALKALGYADQTGFLTMAEDSGLCCDALEGAPGVISARFSGGLKDDDENNAKVLKLMRDVRDDKRQGHFKSAVAVARPGKVIGVVEGVVSGLIAREACGSNGFGYDPIFYYPPFGKTFAQVPSERKNQVSHRSQALQKAKQLLAEHLQK